MFYSFLCCFWHPSDSGWDLPDCCAMCIFVLLRKMQMIFLCSSHEKQPGVPWTPICLPTLQNYINPDVTTKKKTPPTAAPLTSWPTKKFLKIKFLPSSTVLFIAARSWSTLRRRRSESSTAGRPRLTASPPWNPPSRKSFSSAWGRFAVDPRHRLIAFFVTRDVLVETQTHPVLLC